MKMKLLFTAMLAILLAFGMTFVSCDDGSGDKDPPKIPTIFAGTWDSPLYGGFTCFVINGNGTGTVFYNLNITDCTFEYSKVGAVEKLKLIIPEVGGCTYDCSIVDGKLTILNPEPDNEASAALVVYSTTYGPYSRHEAPPGGGDDDFVVPPAALTGTWGNSAVSELFVINADGNGTTYNTVTFAADPCTWSVKDNKLKLHVEYPAYSLVLECIFDYVITGGALNLSNPDPADSALAGYTAFCPLTKAQ
jgi:hypothetical protein